MANGTVSADQAAAKAHIDAVNRDYVLQPRLGKTRSALAAPSGYAWAQHVTVLQIIAPSEVSAAL